MEILDLCGMWKVRCTDGQRGRTEYANRDVSDDARYMDAAVPGEIHLDLMRHGLIADPNVGLNCLSSRWVEEYIWSYRRIFDAPADAMQGRSWLVFEGLDYAATIFLNGKEIGKHSNFFSPCRLEVSGQLRPKDNVLAVHLDAGLYETSEKPCAGWSGALDAKLHKRHWLRKPQCQFSWDWSQRLINVGIHKPVRLEWTSEPVRIEQSSAYAQIDEGLVNGTVTARLIVEGLSDAPVKALLRAALPAMRATAESEIEVKPGVNAYEVQLKVANPELWWPIGCGPQKLYELETCLEIQGKTIGKCRARVGFRNVEVVQEPHPEKGRYFYLKVNGSKIFAKGGNFVPADMIYAAIDKPRYEKLVELAVEANFNFLRVWGGGLYESDDLYDVCDERGILVWQEFIFACGKYPSTDEAFLNSVKTEAAYQIRRLAPHPSLVVWCGNNEMEWGSWDWGFDRGVSLPDYALFHLVLPRLLKAEDPSRYYQPSSPFSPDGRSPNADDAGDQHPWSVGFHDTDFRKYRNMICRFPNEGGILGPTSLPTMLACLPEGHRKVQSFAWQIHDNSVDSWAEPSPIDSMISFWLGKDIKNLTVEEYVYWGGLLQGEGLREYIDNFHRRMYSTSSAIFWMYNDCWPATRSWTIVDYYLRRTPSFHPVRRAFARINVVLAVESGLVKIFGINETDEKVAGKLRYGAFNLAGGFQKDLSAQVVLPPNSSTVIASFDEAEWKSREKSMAFAMLEDKGRLLARNRLFEPLFKDMVWPSADPSVCLSDGMAVFKSDFFAWGVCLDLDGDHGVADNFFDVWPSIPYSIPWTGGKPPKIVRTANLK